MSGLNSISPELLRDYHRLSARQVNTLFGTVVFPEVQEDRIRALGIVKELLLVYDSMNAVNIGFIALKGPLLSYRLYQDATIRNYGDLDILVEVQDILRTKAYLEEIGYGIDYLYWPESRGSQDRLIRRINHISMSNPENGYVIEVHWRLLKTPAIGLSGFRDLVNQNLSTISFAERPFTTLNNELELLYIIIHGGLHFWSRLKWLLDVDMFLKTQEIDWDLFSKLTKDLKAIRMVALCNALLKEYFPEGAGIPCNSDVSLRMLEYSGKRMNGEGETDSGSLLKIWLNIFFTMKAFPGIRYKIKEINTFMFMSLFRGRIRSFKQSAVKILQSKKL